MSRRAASQGRLGRTTCAPRHRAALRRRCHLGVDAGCAALDGQGVGARRYPCGAAVLGERRRHDHDSEGARSVGPACSGCRLVDREGGDRREGHIGSGNSKACSRPPITRVSLPSASSIPVLVVGASGAPGLVVEGAVFPRWRRGAVFPRWWRGAVFPCWWWHGGPTPAARSRLVGGSGARPPVRLSRPCRRAWTSTTELSAGPRPVRGRAGLDQRAFSSTTARAWPTPMQIAATPHWSPLSVSRLARVPRIRAPEAPSG
jgi:hypothetical protein